METTDLEKLEVSISILEEEIANKEKEANIISSHNHAIQWLKNNYQSIKLIF